MYTKPGDDNPFFVGFEGKNYFTHSSEDFSFEEPEDAAVHISRAFGMMELILTVLGLVVFVALLVLLCRCCRRGNRGHVINPPPPPGTVGAAPYPQQQYATVVTTGAYPSAMPGATYPGAAPYPAAPYPGTAPYPAAGAPYPAAYPHPLPQPHVQSAAPSAPDVNDFYGMGPPGWNTQALPPSYDQATSGNYNKHSTPYNPSYGNV